MSSDKPMYLTNAGLSPGDIPADRGRQEANCETAGQRARQRKEGFVTSGDKPTGDIRAATNVVTVGQLADLAFAEAGRHLPRTPERRAASALWTALITTKTIASARNALPGFTTAEVTAAATELLDRLCRTQNEQEQPA